MSEQSQHAPARPYADTARDYRRAGWANPIPVPGKWPPPPGYTGYEGRAVSDPDLQSWIDGDEAGFNIALRLPGDIVGIDVDAYDDKSGAESIGQGEAELGPLPPTSKSTSRAPLGMSSIRFYRVPGNVDLRGAEKKFRARFGDHVDIIRRDHRYAVTWPSVHPVTGEVYQWYDADGAQCTIPSPATLPELPGSWVDFMAGDVAPAADRPQLTDAGNLPRPSPSPWDLPRQFTREQAIDFIRPHFDALRAAPTGTINNLLNDASMVLSHFVPAFWSRDQATRFLLDALVNTAYDGRTWRAESTIHSGLGAPGWRAELVETPEPAVLTSRRVDLSPFLDGTYAPPKPSVGGERDDCARMLYPGRWHSCIAPTGAAKTWLGLWHALAEIQAGRTVAYAHFEEPSPIGTLARLRGLAPNLSNEDIRERFVWLDCSMRWKAGEFGKALPEDASLVILDGINAACSLHGLEVNDTKAVGAYRALFVTPATKRNAAVLSLGHPPKARDRQGERHGFGSTAWLDEVDGVGLRLESSKKTPIQLGNKGYSAVFSVKDRYGQVEARGTLDTTKEGTWYYLGAFWVDDSPERQNIVASMSMPARNDDGNPPDAIEGLANVVLAHLTPTGGRFASQNALEDALRADGVKVNRTDLAPALLRLVKRGALEWPKVPARRARPGWLSGLDGTTMD